ncbi:hypothetical protein O3P69_016290 [Scylla paramamosain]|uniref:DUF4050 domain-containing protein n=1 Tax=Scylla paramamosain TaxID=85552 RepID=A0AAW0SCC1_SCYPA
MPASPPSPPTPHSSLARMHRRNGPTRIAGGRGTGAREGRRRQIRDSKQKHRDSTSGSVRHSSLQDLKCDWRPGVLDQEEGLPAPDGVGAKPRAAARRATLKPYYRDSHPKPPWSQKIGEVLTAMATQWRHNTSSPLG